MKKLIKILFILTLLGLSSKAQIITTVVGNGTYCTFNGDYIPATSTYLNVVSQLTIDDMDNIYYCDYGCSFGAAPRIRKVARARRNL
jgi:hypothetical protein